MTGLDTNVVLRFLLQDDPKQSATVNKLFNELSQEDPAFISLATTLEIVWVLRATFRMSPGEIAAHVEQLLSAVDLVMQNAEEVFDANALFAEGLGEFEDALIGAIGRRANCRETLTFDRKAARLTYFKRLL